jgi:hypothetical protein
MESGQGRIWEYLLVQWYILDPFGFGCVPILTRLVAKSLEGELYGDGHSLSSGAPLIHDPSFETRVDMTIPG